MSEWLVPPWNDAGLRAAMSTRVGGRSAPPWQGLNLGDHVDDAPADVAANRVDFERRLGASPVYLRQVHGTAVVRLTRAHLAAGEPPPVADAAITTEPRVACAVLVADCLPLLFAAPEGRGVGAAHAGWRGLAGGVVEATVLALCDAAHCEPAELRVWLGACIGPRRFEVGADVLRAFAVDPSSCEASSRFVPAPAVAGVAKWHADLAGLARDRLMSLGVDDVSGGDWCTVEDASRFFSFRRDGVTGRMAAAIALDADR